MVAETIIFTTVLIVLLVGTYSDFKWREVPDWMNYGLVFTGFGFRILFTIIKHDWTYVLYGIYGFLAMFLLALVMFYAGQWGGGDSKMIMGIGAMVGLPLAFDAFLIGFILNTIIFGAVFGLFFSLYLALTHRKRFVRDFNRLWKAKQSQKWWLWGAVLLLLIASAFVPFYIKVPVLVIGGLLFASFYVFIYLKAVEKSSMLIYLSPEKLTEGDWIAEDVIVDKRYVCGPKDLGIEQPQIKRLLALKKKGKVDKVLVKVGIPFVPSFLIAFIVTYFWGNVVFAIIGF
jgi:Flp pilus assembly protein protease CpaA